MVKLLPDQAREIYEGVRYLLNDRSPDIISGGFEEAFEQLREQIRDGGSGNHNGGELLDIVANILAENRGRNVLTGKLLTTLRSALLSPSEMAKLKAMEKSHVGCAMCGRTLHNGELMTISSQAPVCINCMTPESVTCGNCQQSLPLTDGIRRIAIKTLKECAHCKAGEVPKSDEDVKIELSLAMERETMAAEQRRLRDQAITRPVSNRANPARVVYQPVSRGGVPLGGTFLGGNGTANVAQTPQAPAPPASPTADSGPSGSWTTIGVANPFSDEDQPPAAEPIVIPRRTGNNW